MKRLAAAWLMGTGLALTPAAWAQGVGSPINALAPAKAWSDLSAQQREVLAPLASQWATLDAGSRDQWLALAAHYPMMDDADQARARQRLQAWARMSASERGQARQGFVSAQRVDAAQREAKWAAYQQLPDERRQALQERGALRAAAAPSRPVAAARLPSGVSTVQPGQKALPPARWRLDAGAPPASAPRP